MSGAEAIAIQVGVQVALAVATAALRQRRTIDTGGLENLSIQTSALGEVIPLGYGTIRAAGVVHAAGEKEEVVRRESAGKGLFGGDKIIRRTYFATFGTAIGQREPQAILRIWADRNVEYDSKTATGEADRKAGLVFRLAGGGAGQDADPALVGLVGAANAPAYRGIATVWHDRLPLADYGNRVPQVEYEIAHAASAAARFAIRSADDVIDQAAARTLTCIDRARGVVWAIPRDAPVGDVDARYLTCHSIRTGELLASRPWPEILAECDPDGASGIEANSSLGTLAGGSSDRLILQKDLGNNSALLFVDKSRFVGTGRLGVSNTNANTTLTTYPPASQIGVVPITDALGQVVYIAFGGIKFGTTIGSTNPWWMVRINPLGQPEYLWGKDVAGAASRQVVGVQAGPEEKGARWIYFATRETASLGGTGPITIRRVRVLFQAYYNQISDVTVGVVGPETVWTQSSGTNGAGAVAMAWDEAAGGLLVSDPGHGVGLLDVDAGTWTWFEAGAEGQGPFADQVGAVVSEGSGWPVVDGDAFRFRDPATGGDLGTEFRWDEEFTDPGPGNVLDIQPGALGAVWDPVGQRLWAIGNAQRSFFTVYGPRSAAVGESLSSVVADLCARAGLAPAEIDVTGLSGTVSGYAMTRQESVRAQIARLAAAYDFDAYEAGGQLVFRHHDAAADWTVPEADLVRMEDGELVVETKGDAVSLPSVVTCTSPDAGNDYLPDTQEARRIRAPVAVVGSLTSVAVDLPGLVLTTDERRAICERTLWRSWAERGRAKLRLPRAYLGVTTGDVLEVTAKGQTRRWRVVREAKVSGWAIEVEAVATHPNLFAGAHPGLTAEGAPGVTSGVAGQAGRLLPFVLDLPTLQVGDDPGGRTALVYAATARPVTARADPWGVNALMVSLQGAAFASRASMGAEAVWAVTETAMPDMPALDWNGLQEVSLELRVIEGIDSFVGVTRDELLGSYVNAAALRNPSGAWEILSFRDVALLGGGRIRLTGFTRGRRGTEVAGFGHRAGEPLVLLGADWVEAFTLSSIEAGRPGRVAAVARGQDPDTADQVQVSWTLNSLRPFRPSGVTATASGGAITIAFTRRSRSLVLTYDGGIDVPLAEETEAYEIDILDGAGGAVLRTLSGTSSPIVYGATEVAADWGSVPPALTLQAYQISAAVGRGRSAEIEVTVT